MTVLSFSLICLSAATLMAVCWMCWTCRQLRHAMEVGQAHLFEQLHRLVEVVDQAEARRQGEQRAQAERDAKLPIGATFLPSDDAARDLERQHQRIEGRLLHPNPRPLMSPPRSGNSVNRSGAGR